jgi:anti-sigma regulatory factor (Ser/Thr protein kinase)
VPTVLLQFPSKSAYVAVARLAVSGVARAAGLDEETIFDLKTAVSEALSSAVLYGDEGAEDKPITLTWDDRPDSVVIEVRYAGGRGEDASGDERQAMSVALLRSLVDQSEFVSEEDGTTTVRLTLRR